MTKALDIALEYLDSGSAEQRKNALVALRAIGTEPALKALARIAIESKEPELKRQSRAELQQAQVGRQSELIEYVVEQIGSGPNAGAAYSLLGELRQGGPARARLRVSPLTRLRLAGRLYALAYGGWQNRWRTGLWQGVLGGVIGAVVFLVYLSAVLGIGLFEDVGSLLFFWGLVAVPLVVWLPASHATAIGSYPFLADGLLVEASRAFLWMLPLGILVTFAVGAALQVPAVPILVVSLLFLTIPSVVRAGTALANGAASGWRGSLLQIACGLAAGILFSSLAGLALVTPTANTGLSLDSCSAAGSSWASCGAFYYKSLWALIVPTCAGLAAAFAAIDRQTAKEHQAAAASPKRRTATLAVVTSLILLALAPASGRMFAVAAVAEAMPRPSDPGDQPVEESVLLPAVPASYRLKIGRTRQLDASVPHLWEDALHRTFTLKLTGSQDADQQRVAADSTYTTFLRGTLAAGDYAIEVTDTSGVSSLAPSHVLDALVAATRGRRLASVRLTVRLSAPLDDAEPGFDGDTSDWADPAFIRFVQTLPTESRRLGFEAPTQGQFDSVNVWPGGRLVQAWRLENCEDRPVRIAVSSPELPVEFGILSPTHPKPVVSQYSTTGSELEFTCEQGSDYAVIVSGSTTAKQFTLRAWQKPDWTDGRSVAFLRQLRPEEPALGLSDSREADLASAEASPSGPPVRAWVLQSCQGERVRVQVSPSYLSTFDSALLALGPGIESPLVADNASGTDAVLDINCTRAGDYRVFVTGYGAGDRPFTLSTSPAPDPDWSDRESVEFLRALAPENTPLRIDSTIEGVLDEQAPMSPRRTPTRAWTLEQCSGERVRVEASSTDFDMFLIVLDSGAKDPLMNDDAVGRDSALEFDCRQSVSYKVIVSPLGDGGQGRFIVKVSRSR